MAKNKKKATSPEKAAAKAAEKEVPAYAAKKKETPKKEKKTEKESKPGFWTNFKDFWKGLFKELKKINWSFLVVLLVILVIGIGVWVFDALFVKIRELIYNYSPADAEAAVILLKAQIGLL